MSRFECPDEMIPHIEQLFKDEYALPGYTKKNPVILDIGANVGGFAVWALAKWPSATIHCYEPNPENFKYLEKNLKNIHDTKENQFNLNNSAVGDPSRNKLYLGKHNCGECSLYQVGEQKEEYINITTIHPIDLPHADVLKIDTEGSELDILLGLPRIEYDAIALEYHSEKDRRIIDNILCDYTAVHGFIRTKDRGVISYIHNRLL
jgi:FkbM family methyltransferase